MASADIVTPCDPLVLDGMSRDITHHAVMRDLQGDRVIIFQRIEGNGELYVSNVMTIQRVVDQGQEALHLVNREVKIRKPDWLMTQAMLDALKPALENNEFKAKWQMTVRPILRS